MLQDQAAGQESVQKGALCLSSDDQALELAQIKYQREHVEKFLKVLDDDRAKAIAREPASNEARIEKLGRHMFGEAWQ